MKRYKWYIALLVALLALPFITYGLMQCTSTGKISKIAIEEIAPAAFQLTVDGRPYLIKGVCYHPLPIGKGHDHDFINDSAKPWLIDGPMMKKMGANTIRLYQAGSDADRTKDMIRYMYTRCGIRTVLGHYLGFWDYPPMNYGDAGTRAAIKENVIEMVNTYKDEPGILAWVLGNENNYSFDLDVRPWSTPEIDKIESHYERRIEQAKIYYAFVEDIARAIKEIDPSRPIIMGNGELASIDIAKDLCPSIDALGGIIYQGQSFGTYWRRLQKKLGKPNVFIEFGCDSYNSETGKEDQDAQAAAIAYQWKEIVDNAAGGGGMNNSLGGFVFEWTDEWWKSAPEYDPGWNIHDTSGGWSNSAYYDRKSKCNMNEEWWGIVAISPEMERGVNKRVPKKAYYLLKKLWR